MANPIVGEFWSVRAKVQSVRVTDNTTWYTVRFRKSEQTVDLVERDFLELLSAPSVDWKDVPFGTSIEVRQTDLDPWVPAVFVSFDVQSAELWALRVNRDTPRVFSQYRLVE